MSELILHHYPMSPFAEKVRLMLGYKQLPWRSVIIPPVMPKPDVVALTGGYRKTPILQIGADVYCDTALIARVLEARQPQPTLYPASAPLAVALAQWADGMLFGAAVSWAMQPAGVAAILGEQPPEVLKAFAADRAAMRANAPRPTLADATAQLKQHLSAIAAQLQQGGPWLFGAAPSLLDFSVGHCLWFIRMAKPVAYLLDEYPAIGAWLDRLLAIGHHRSTVMSSTEALAVASAATAHAPAAVEPGLGFEAGQAVTVAATDYGVDPVAGILVGLSLQESVLRRSDARAGTVHVHFPRFGFQIKVDKT
jgi:glutathione S-transferase